jgi:hypothetical protein
MAHQCSLARRDDIVAAAGRLAAGIAQLKTTVPLPSGNVTFLFTDVEGSTRLWEADLNAWAWSMHAFTNAIAGRFEDSLAAAQHALALAPHALVAHWSLLECLMSASRHREALDRKDETLEISGRHPWILAPSPARMAPSVTRNRQDSSTTNWSRAKGSNTCSRRRWPA